MKAFLKQVQKFQWDDHRYYHQSRINQTLHLVSACWHSPKLKWTPNLRQVALVQKKIRLVA